MCSENVEVALPLLGERDRAGGARDEADSELALEIGDVPGHE